MSGYRFRRPLRPRICWTCKRLITFIRGGYRSARYRLEDADADDVRLVRRRRWYCQMCVDKVKAQRREFDRAAKTADAEALRVLEGSFPEARRGT